MLGKTRQGLRTLPCVTTTFNEARAAMLGKTVPESVRARLDPLPSTKPEQQCSGRQSLSLCASVTCSRPSTKPEQQCSGRPAASGELIRYRNALQRSPSSNAREDTLTSCARRCRRASFNEARAAMLGKTRHDHPHRVDRSHPSTKPEQQCSGRPLLAAHDAYAAAVSFNEAREAMLGKTMKGPYYSVQPRFLQRSPSSNAREDIVKPVR